MFRFPHHVLAAEPDASSHRIACVTQPAIVWFRNDLRLADNPALTAAVASGGEVDPGLHPGRRGRRRLAARAGPRAGGCTARWRACRRAGRPGPAAAAARAAIRPRQLDRLVARDAAPTAVVLEPALRALGDRAGQGDQGRARARGVRARSFNGSLGREPWEVAAGGGEPYKVFTPFWRAWAELGPLPGAAAGARTRRRRGSSPTRRRWLALELLPTAPDWAGGPARDLAAGRGRGLGRARRLRRRAHRRLQGRRATSRREPGVSRLSPQLHHGELSPRQIWHARPGGGGRRCRGVPAPAGLARVRLSPAVPLPAAARHAAAAGVRPLPLVGRCRPVPRLVPGPDRLPDRRRRHARALAHRLHAQPGADDRGLVPDQGPADPLAAGRGLVLGHAVRRRPRQQLDGLAVGGRLRHRRRPLFPHLQPGQPGGEVRPRGRLCPPLGAGAGPAARRRSSTTRPPPAAMRCARPMSGSARPIRGRSSTMRPHGCGRWRRIRG